MILGIRGEINGGVNRVPMVIQRIGAEIADHIHVIADGLHGALVTGGIHLGVLLLGFGVNLVTIPAVMGDIDKGKTSVAQSPRLPAELAPELGIKIDGTIALTLGVEAGFTKSGNIETGAGIVDTVISHDIQCIQNHGLADFMSFFSCDGGSCPLDKRNEILPGLHGCIGNAVNAGKTGLKGEIIRLGHTTGDRGLAGSVGAPQKNGNAGEVAGNSGNRRIGKIETHNIILSIKYM